MSAYIKKTERSQINDLMLHVKLLEKQEQANTKTNRKSKIIKIQPKSMKWKKKTKELVKQKVVSLKKEIRLTDPWQT
jgi:hypothetical protein